MGIVKTKGLLREKVWWAGIDQDLEHLIKSCHSCQVTSQAIIFQCQLHPEKYVNQCAHAENKDYGEELNKFSFLHRTSPHQTTSAAPQHYYSIHMLETVFRNLLIPGNKRTKPTKSN